VETANWDIMDFILHEARGPSSLTKLAWQKNLITKCQSASHSIL